MANKLEISIPEKPPSEEHLELWSHYDWYRGPLLPQPRFLSKALTEK